MKKNGMRSVPPGEILNEEFFESAIEQTCDLVRDPQSAKRFERRAAIERLERFEQILRIRPSAELGG